MNCLQQTGLAKEKGMHAHYKSVFILVCVFYQRRGSSSPSWVFFQASLQSCLFVPGKYPCTSTNTNNRENLEKKKEAGPFLFALLSIAYFSDSFHLLSPIHTYTYIWHEFALHSCVQKHHIALCFCI